MRTGFSLVALVLLASLPASAQVSSVSGSAYGYRAYDMTLFGAPQSNTGPTPTATLAPNASNSPASVTVPTGLVKYGPTTLFTSDGITVDVSGAIGPGGFANSSSTVNHVNEATTQPTTGGEFFTADQVVASCASTTSGRTGSTSITSGTLQTDNGLDQNEDGDFSDAGEHPPVVVAIPVNPAPNTTIPGHLHLGPTTTDSFEVVFNEQVTGSNQLTVNAVHERYLGAVATGHVIVGQAVCGVVPEPGSTMMLAAGFALLLLIDRTRRAPS